MTARKTLFAALAAATAVAAVAAPAAAQTYGRYDHRNDQGRYEQDRYDRGGWDRRADEIDRREADLRRQIAIADRRGVLSGREYRKVSDGLRTIEQQEARMRPGGLDRVERAELNRRLDLLQFSLNGRINNAEYARR